MTGTIILCLSGFLLGLVLGEIKGRKEIFNRFLTEKEWKILEALNHKTYKKEIK